MDNEAPAAPAQPQPDVAAVPDTWPGAFGAYKHSKAAVKFNLGTVLTLIVAYLVVAVVLSLVFKRSPLGQLITELVAALFGLNFAFVVLAGVHRTKVEINDSLKETGSLYLNYVLLSILTSISYAVSLILLIVPFFFVYPRLVLATYYLVDKRMNAIDAYKASWHETKGHEGKVWGITGASIAMALLMFTIIGIPFSLYFLLMYSAANGVLYVYLTAHKAAAPAPAAPASAPPAVPAA